MKRELKPEPIATATYATFGAFVTYATFATMDLAQNIRFTHILTVIFGVIASVHSLRLFVSGHAKVAAFLALLGVLHFCLPLVSRWKSGKATRLIFLFFLALGIYQVSLAMGEAAHVHWMFFSVALIPMLIFDRKEKTQLILGLLLPVAGYVLTVRALMENPQGIPGFSNPGDGLYVSPITVMATVWGIGFALLRNSHRFSEELKSSMLKASQNADRFKAMVDGSPDHLLRISAEGLCMDSHWRGSGSDIVFPTDLSGKNLDDFPFPPDAKIAAKAALRETLATGEVQSVNTIFPSDKGFRYFEMRISRSGDKEAVFLLRDVTDHHITQAKLRQGVDSLSRLNHDLAVHQRAVDNHAIVAYTDLAGNISQVNDKFCQISGYDREELIGSNHRILKSGIHPPEFYRDLWKTISSGRVWHGELCNRRKDGELYWVDSTLVPICDVNGRPIQYMAIRTDITSRKHHEEKLALNAQSLKRKNVELQEASDRALASTRAKSDFLATMSHEIRTPMNGILGMTGLLLDADLTPAQRDCAMTIQSSGEALLTLINDILDFSKIEAGKLDIEILPFHFETAVQEMCDLLAFKATEKGVSFSLKTDANIPPCLLGDPGRIRQVLINLTGNAIKFTEKGHVLIDIGLEGRDEGGRARLLFKVTDTGMGISPEQAANLFQPFSQADTSTTRRFGGTGLGLAICRRLVDLMGGELGLDSEIGKGSCFWFRLSLPVQASGDWNPGSVLALQGQRVLVVDDFKLDSGITAEVLTHAGLRVDQAQNGEEALQKVEAAMAAGDPYAMAMVDWLMPVMDGEEFAKTLRRKNLTPSPALVMLTASAHRGIAKRMASAGFIGFLVKPIASHLLVQAAKEALERCLHGEPEDLPLITRHRLIETKKAAPDASDSLAGLRILLVEDNIVNQKVASQILRKFGCRVDLAGNGVEALRMTKSLPYDLVLMDCQMPEMDGFDATRQIRATETCRLPIIAMTANAMQGDRERCLEAGMDDYLAKPVNADALQRILRKWHPDRREKSPL